MGAHHRSCAGRGQRGDGISRAIFVRATPVLALALLGLYCPAALAEAALDTKTVTVSSDVTITVAAPADLGASNERVTVDVPGGFRVLSCDHVDGFQCSHAKAVEPNRTVVTWQSVGPVRSLALRSDRFPFRMRASDKAGAYPLAVTQFHVDGSAVRTAPVLEVRAAGVRASPAPAATAAPRAAVRTLSVTATTQPRVAALAVSPPDDPVVVASDRRSQTSSDPLMMVLGVVATLAAGGVYWLRRRVATLDA